MIRPFVRIRALCESSLPLSPISGHYQFLVIYTAGMAYPLLYYYYVYSPHTAYNVINYF